MPACEVKDKILFVTGGASGIGKGVIEAALSKEAKVFFIDVQEEAGTKTLHELQARFGHDNIAFTQCDVTDRKKFEEAFQKAVTRFGQIDVMYNNAGIVSEARPKFVVDVNLLGCIYGTEIAMAHMRKDKGGRGGRIINMSSIAGVEVTENIPIYGATKQGVRCFTISHAVNLDIDQYGVEFAVLLPDTVENTGMYANLKEGDILFLERALKRHEGLRTIPLETVAQAFLKLLTLEKMNGAMLLVTIHKTHFIEVKVHDIGDNYPAAV